MKVYTLANKNFRFFVAAPDIADAAHAFADTQGFHGYNDTDAWNMLTATDVHTWGECYTAALAEPLTVHELDLPRFGVRSDLTARPLTLPAEHEPESWPCDECERDIVSDEHVSDMHASFCSLNTANVH